MSIADSPTTASPTPFPHTSPRGYGRVPVTDDADDERFHDGLESAAPRTVHGAARMQMRLTPLSIPHGSPAPPPNAGDGSTLDVRPVSVPRDIDAAGFPAHAHSSQGPPTADAAAAVRPPASAMCTICMYHMHARRPPVLTRCACVQKRPRSPAGSPAQLLRGRSGDAMAAHFGLRRGEAAAQSAPYLHASMAAVAPSPSARSPRPLLGRTPPAAGPVAEARSPLVLASSSASPAVVGVAGSEQRRATSPCSIAPPMLVAHSLDGCAAGAPAPSLAAPPEPLGLPLVPDYDLEPFVVATAGAAAPSGRSRPYPRSASGRRTTVCDSASVHSHTLDSDGTSDCALSPTAHGMGPPGSLNISFTVSRSARNAAVRPCPS